MFEIIKGSTRFIRPNYMLDELTITLALRSWKLASQLMSVNMSISFSFPIFFFVFYYKCESIKK